MLELQNITKKFGEIVAVDNCSFEIEKGKITALIGPNGSGKTTIFNLISGIVKADKGEIILDDEKVTNFPIDKVARLGISRTLQQTGLFLNLTVSENLLLAMNNENTKFWKNTLGFNKQDNKKAKRVEEKLKELNIFEIRHKLVGELSFGQKKLTELAMTFSKPHQLLMLDEPVSGVSQQIRSDIANFLLGAKKNGQTILLIEHDMNFTFRVADDIIVINAGQIIARGTPEEIKKNELVLDAYLGH